MDRQIFNNTGLYEDILSVVEKYSGDFESQYTQQCYDFIKIQPEELTVFKENGIWRLHDLRMNFNLIKGEKHHERMLKSDMKNVHSEKN